MKPITKTLYFDDETYTETYTRHSFFDYKRNFLHFFKKGKRKVVARNINLFWDWYDYNYSHFDAFYELLLDLELRQDTNTDYQKQLQDIMNALQNPRLSRKKIKELELL